SAGKNNRRTNRHPTASLYNEEIRPSRYLSQREPIAHSGEADMTQHNADEGLSEPRRKEIFQALVDAQDHEMTVAQSRKLIGERFGVSEHQIRWIEREGLDQQWPPL